MGWGRWALMAKAFGCNSFGNEMSEEKCKYAKSNGIVVIKWDEIPHYEFDFINTEQVFEHLPEPLITLKHLKMALKKDGVIKISVPTINDVERRLKIMDWTAEKGRKNSLNFIAPLEHINYFRRKSLLAMAEKAGLQEVLMPIKTQYRYTFDWGKRKRIAKNILLPIFRNFLKNRNYLFLKET
jgi:SAM-dependent methyltransferase